MIMTTHATWSPDDYYLFLSSIPLIGARRFAKILIYWPRPEDFWHATRDDLVAVGLAPKIIQAILAARQNVDLAALWRAVAAAKVTLLRQTDEGYPPLLRQIHDWPPLLYYRGRLMTQPPLVAIVGSRHPSAYGLQATAELVGDLVAAGVGIVSGVAPGIDQAAHRAALAADGYTVGVLGTGLDARSVSNPDKQKLMAEMVAAGGAVVSEFPLGTPGGKFTFPLRNRLISGMSQMVVVVEAATKSGALITAHSALDQGRNVGAVPGSIWSATSAGCHELLRQGANVVTSAGDILSELGLAVTEPAPARPAPELEPDAQQIWHLLSSQPTHIDQIIWQTGLPSDTVNTLLVQLEMAGLIRHLGGMNYTVS